jgi:hypothetical protein
MLARAVKSFVGVAAIVHCSANLLWGAARWGAMEEWEQVGGAALQK